MNMKYGVEQNLPGLMVILATLTILSGCAAMHTAIAKKDLDVQTKMSETIFLDPVGPSKKVIFIQVRNTSDKQNFEVVGPIRDAIAAKGYRITEDPEEAYYWLLANVLSVAKASPTAAEAALHAGFGGTVAGVVGGAMIGSAAGYRGAAYGAGAGGLVAGLVETVANAAVKDVLFVVITDIEISEKAKEGVIVRQDSKQDAKQGIGGVRQQISSEVTDVKKYRTRIVSSANKVNLEYEEAAPELTRGLIRALSGLF